MNHSIVSTVTANFMHELVPTTFTPSLANIFFNDIISQNTADTTADREKHDQASAVNHDSSLELSTILCQNINRCLEQLFLYSKFASRPKFYPPNIDSMPLVKFFADLDLERKP